MQNVSSTIGNYGKTDTDTDLVWHKYFMGIALLSAKRTKDIKGQMGTCIVNNEPRVVGMGYLGMPLNCADLITWGSQGHFARGTDREHKKLYYVCHAELNAIVSRNPMSVKGCTIYVPLFPCNECTKIIIASGITRVVYLSEETDDKVELQDSKSMLDAKGVGCVKLKIPIEIPTEDIHFNGESPFAGDKEISWEHYFMALAVWSGKVRGEANDPEKEGACIVNEDNRIVGLGFVQNIEGKFIRRDSCVMHAPVRAIVNESPASLKGCTMYTVRHPCNECAKVIVQSGITKVIYLDKDKRCHDDMLRRKFSEDMKDEELVRRKMEEKKLAADAMFAIGHIIPKPYTENDSKMKSLSVDFVLNRSTLEESSSAANN